MITYVSSIYDAFPKVPEGGEGISAIVRASAFHACRPQVFCGARLSVPMQLLGIWAVGLTLQAESLEASPAVCTRGLHR